MYGLLSERNIEKKKDYLLINNGRGEEMKKQYYVLGKNDKISCILRNLRDCEFMRKDGAKKNAIKSFLQIAVDVYGKDTMLNVIADFGDRPLTKYARIIEKLPEGQSMVWQNGKLY